MVSEVRLAIWDAAEKEASGHRIKVASGRSLHQDERSPTLLWRAVDQYGAVIDILVQPKRDRWAALRFFRKLLHVAKRPPRVIITDKLRSYAAAKKLIMPEIEHRGAVI
jgi:putative transposase